MYNVTECNLNIDGSLMSFSEQKVYNHMYRNLDYEAYCKPPEHHLAPR